MATATNRITEQSIRPAAIAAGFADASVVRYVERRPYRCTDEQEVTDQVWYVLAIKRSVDSDFEVIGRRRTKAELLGLIDTIGSR